MTQKFTRNSQKTAITLAILAAVAAGAWLLFRDNKPSPADNQAAERANNAQQAANSEADGSGSETTSQSVAANKGTVSISNFSEDASRVYVRALVSGVSDGSCELELSKAGALTLKKQAPVEPITTYYSCAFDIPKSEISQSGIWTASVKVKGSSEKAVSATLNINK